MQQGIRYVWSAPVDIEFSMLSLKVFDTLDLQEKFRDSCVLFFVNPHHNSTRIHAYCHTVFYRALEAATEDY